MKYNSSSQSPFWERKSLDEMTQSEWESLCDGCGRCCLNKLEDWDTGEIVWTNVTCTLLDDNTCRCKDYENRFEIVPDCLQLSPKMVRELTWLPPTCAYKLLNDGKPLPKWHPLISGTQATVLLAGVKVTARTISEDAVKTEDLENHIVKWPGKVPKAAKG